MKRIYLDYAAATPVSPAVLRTMLPFFTDNFYNPSALYSGARSVKLSLENARSGVAKTIGAKPSEIIFTSGGSESANLAIKGLMNKHPDSELIVSTIEHDAVLKPAKNYKYKDAEVDEKGRVKLDKLLDSISDNTVLISVMLVNNEIGTIQPVKEIVEKVEKIRKERKNAGNKLPLLVHTDACQAPLYLDVNVANLGIDMMTLNGGKIYGPKQSGILYIRSGVVLKALIEGGGQEYGLRSGTENVAFAVGFNEALKRAQKSRVNRSKTVANTRDIFMKKLESKLGANINGDRKHRVANNIHATFPGADNERVLFALDDLGVDAAAGSACSASSDVSSHVLIAIGKSDQEARSSIRFSIAHETTIEDINKTIELLKIALKS